MSNNLERIQTLIGKTRLERIFEVMGILGVEFPSDFEIYGKNGFSAGLSRSVGSLELVADHYENYAIVLSENDKNWDNVNQNQLDSLGYLEFNDKFQSLVFIKNGIFYKWDKSGENHETLRVCFGGRHTPKNDLSVSLNLRNEGLNSSDMIIRGIYDFPVIRSYIGTIEARDSVVEFEEKLPIDLYYEFFKQLLMSKRFGYKIPESLQQEDLLNTIARVFEGPINNLVTDLKENDQTWRFEREEKKIICDCSSEEAAAKRELDETVANANRKYKFSVHGAEDRKNSKLEELARLAKEYSKSQTLGK